jgi:hypothetical protein
MCSVMSVCVLIDAVEGSISRMVFRRSWSVLRSVRAGATPKPAGPAALAMPQRCVDALRALRDDRTCTACAIEQQDRAIWLRRALNRLPDTDWSCVRKGAGELLA